MQANMATAAVLCRLNSPLEIMALEIPALEKGQVLVKVLYSGVCRSQLMEVEGGRGEDPWLPHLLGHEGCGEVVDVGVGVNKVKIGDKVILGWIKGEGADVRGPTYRKGGMRINSGPVTTFSNYTVVSENRLVVKPETLSDAEAVLFGCAVPTGAGMVLNELDAEQGDSILIIGLGGVGLSAVITLMARSMNNVFVADVCEEKLILARDFGVKHTFNLRDNDFRRQLRAVAPDGLDYCLECAGRVETIELGFSLLNRRHGSLLFASHPPDGEKICLLPHELIMGKKIAGSCGGATRPDVDIPIISKLVKEARVPIDALLTKRYALEDINIAFQDLAQGRVFRPLIVMSHA